MKSNDENYFIVHEGIDEFYQKAGKIQFFNHKRISYLQNRLLKRKIKLFIV